MVELINNLFIGSQEDYEYNVKRQSDWFVVHACKEPYHRILLGYKSRSAPKNHPEYLIGKRENRLFLNIIDVDNPDYIPKVIIDAAMEFIESSLSSGNKCLVHCNQGESRSPSIGLLYLASKGILANDFLTAEHEFRKIYPAYKPKNGIRRFLMNNWNLYVR